MKASKPAATRRTWSGATANRAIALGAQWLRMRQAAFRDDYSFVPRTISRLSHCMLGSKLSDAISDDREAPSTGEDVGS